MNAFKRLLAALERGSVVYLARGLRGEEIMLEAPSQPRLEPGILLTGEEISALRSYAEATSDLVQSIAEARGVSPR